jgi:DNA-binding MarR family transcriptional regulator
MSTAAATSPFAVNEAGRSCVLYNLHRAVRAAAQLYDAEFRNLGLRSTQVFLLSAIEYRQPVTLGQLAEATVLDRTTLSRNLKPLRNVGLIQVKAGKDRRVREISLTNEGRKRLNQAFPLWQRSQEVMAGKLGTPAITDLLTHLKGIVKIARAM